MEQPVICVIVPVYKAEATRLVYRNDHTDDGLFHR